MVLLSLEVKLCRRGYKKKLDVRTSKLLLLNLNYLFEVSLT